MRQVVVNICSGEAGGEAILMKTLNQAIEAFRRIFGNCKDEKELTLNTSRLRPPILNI